MKTPSDVEYRVTIRHNNVIVSVQRAPTRERADDIVRRVTATGRAEAEVEEIRDPSATDLSRITRDVSESTGWRRVDSEVAGAAT